MACCNQIAVRRRITVLNLRFSIKKLHVRIGLHFCNTVDKQPENLCTQSVSMNIYIAQNEMNDRSTFQVA